MNLQCIHTIGPYPPGTVIPRHAVDDPEWQISIGHAANTAREPTIDVPIPSAAPPTVEAAQVENARLRRDALDAVARIEQERAKANEARIECDLHKEEAETYRVAEEKFRAIAADLSAEVANLKVALQKAQLQAGQ